MKPQGNLRRWVWVGLMLVTLVLTTPGRSAAQDSTDVLVLTRDTERVDIGPYLSTLPDPGGALTFADVQTLAFTPLDDEPLQGYHRTRPLWAQFTVTGAEDGEWLLEVTDGTLIDYLDVYVVTGDAVRTTQTGLLRPFNTRDFPHNHFVFRVSVTGGETTVVYLRVAGLASNRSGVGLRLWSPMAFAEATVPEQAFDGVFFGSTLILMLFFLAIGLSLKSREFTVFGVFVGLYMTVPLVVYGHGPQYLWPGWPVVSTKVLVVLNELRSMFFIVWVMVFFTVWARWPQWYRLGAGVVLTDALVSAVTIVWPGPVQYAVDTALVAVVLLYGLALPVVALRSGYRPARAFLIGAAMPIVANLVQAGMGVLGLGNPWFVNRLVDISFMLSVLLFSFALAEVVSSLQRDREQALSQVRALNVGLEARIAERTAALQLAKDEAEQARDEAVQANLVKSQFLSAMSHELRTPLNAIINFTQFVSTGMMGEINARQQDALQKATGAARHLLALINDVLDISRIEAGRMELWIEAAVDLAPLLAETRMLAEGLLADKPVEAKLVLVGELPLVACDQRRVKQVLINLVSNACKFTEAGEVVIRGMRQNGAVVIGVADTGPGIDAADHERIFEMFGQSATGRRAGSIGSGLGLPISRRLVEAHGGRLWVESAAGAGAVFWFSLPVGE